MFVYGFWQISKVRSDFLWKADNIYEICINASLFMLTRYRRKELLRQLRPSSGQLTVLLIAITTTGLGLLAIRTKSHFLFSQSWLYCN